MQRIVAEAIWTETLWGDLRAAPDGPPVVYQHEECGELVRLSFTCDPRGQTLAAMAEVVATPGPGAR